MQTYRQLYKCNELSFDNLLLKENGRGLTLMGVCPGIENK